MQQFGYARLLATAVIGAVGVQRQVSWHHVDDKSTHTKQDCGLIANAPSGTSCPDEAWIDEMVTAAIPPARGAPKVFLNIGCNKGNDAMAWLDRFDMSDRTWSTQTWIDQLTAMGISHFECAPSVPGASVKSQLSVVPETQPIEPPRSVCVEPMASNIELLQNVSQALGLSEKSFEIIAAAASDHSGTVDFPDFPAGTEYVGLHGSLQQKVRTPVQLTTVDEIVASHNLGLVDVLSIDTEGADPDVLKGASSTLASVRYLEFEVHRDLNYTSWSKTTLRSVVDDLDAKSFDCFWAGDNGKLVNVLQCWQDDFERGEWANVVCAKRGDIWNDVLQRFATA